jgi:hypothetical protein
MNDGSLMNAMRLAFLLLSTAKSFIPGVDLRRKLTMQPGGNADPGSLPSCIRMYGVCTMYIDVLGNPCLVQSNYYYVCSFLAFPNIRAS